tara:strand:- start:546 stop:1073 length:528 start_codon:yes stop_codon:yes gene_type:complete
MNLSFEQIEKLSPDLVWFNSLEKATTKNLSDNLKSWLTETSLLTYRIKESGHKYTVEVLRESLSPTPTLLKNKNDANQNYIREVALSINNDACILAQTLVPNSTLELNRWIESLGQQPLGERLSMMPKVSRSAFEYAYIELSEISIWIRRSSFDIDDALIWVAELFLPALDRITD